MTPSHPTDQDRRGPRDWERIARSAVDIEVKDHLRAAIEAGKKLRVKFGIDPSAPDIHLGHTVVLGKLRDFQELGHTAVLIIGDFTARIGDPSGQSETRRPLEPHEVDANAETYLQQVFKVLDKDATEVRLQSEWFGQMSLAEVMKLAGRTTVAQITAREDFAERLKAGRALGLHELLYPLMQGYDSVAVQSDLELGGTDQLFNLLFGREMQRAAGQEAQDVLTMPLLEGLDGVHAMSKSRGNYVGVDEPPAEIYGKLMSLPDHLIVRYMRMVSGMDEAEIGAVEAALSAGENPRDAKMRLAQAIVERFHDASAASAAEDSWRAQFQQGERPDEIDEVRLPAEISGGASVASTLVALGLATSKSEARRLVAQRGVRVNDQTAEDAEMVYTAADGDLWQVGKRRFLRIRTT
jgi:tyrosyl-tRNA synthetase